MKKSIILTVLIGLFVIIGNNVTAQISESVAVEIETTSKSAIITIKKDKSLSESEKSKFIDRIHAVLATAKKEDNKNAKKRFNLEYKRIADNYARITGKTLPALKEN